MTWKVHLSWLAFVLILGLLDVLFGNDVEEDIKEIKKMLKEKNG